jgi:dihydroorotase
MTTLVKNATIINEGRRFVGSLLFGDDSILQIFTQEQNLPSHADSVIDATGCFLLPGVIDEHVHFREPGMTNKGDIFSESQAAAAGGVTSVFEMPNTNPPTTTLDCWQQKMDLAHNHCLVNYAFYFGATNNNASLLPQLDIHRICGVKLFMGSSTGNMLVDQDEALNAIFKLSPLLIVTHCEDTAVITRNAADIKQVYGPNADVKYHSAIRSAEACILSTQKAIRMALQTGARLHIAHVSTAAELQLIRDAGPSVSAEACISHLLFCEDDYPHFGTRIKCNPAVKTARDRDELRRALSDDRILTVATDHAPHLLSEKQGGAFSAASGMPMVQFSLPAMLSLADHSVLSLERVVELMCHRPARLFQVQKRGFIRPGFKADFVLLKHVSHVVSSSDILSKCGWSPLEGCTLQWTVDKTFCNGHLIYNNGNIDTNSRGEAVLFNRA